MNDNQVRIGVIGVGHLGQHHVKHYKTLDNVELIGVFDIDLERSSEISKKFDVKVFDNLNSILEKVDALSIVTNTEHHFKIAEKCLKSKRHVLGLLVQTSGSEPDHPGTSKTVCPDPEILLKMWQSAFKYQEFQRWPKPGE